MSDSSASAPARPVDRTGHAVAFMLVSAMGFTLMGVAVRASGELPLVQKVMLRNLVTAVAAGAWVARDGRGSVLARRPHSWRVVLRSFSGLIGVGCYFYALDRMALADATMLNKLSPFFVFLFARVFLKEPLSRRLAGALVVAFVGALLVIKPRFDASVVPALIGAASSVFAATAYTLVRSLRGLEPPHRIVFAFSAISTIATAPLAAAAWVAPTGAQWAALLGIGIGAAVGQFGLTYAYQLAQAAKVSVVNYSGIVFALAAGLVFWGEWPDVWSLLGGGMIVTGAALSQLRWRTRPPHRTEDAADAIDLDAARSFYASVGYDRPLAPDDRVLVSSRDGAVVAAVRLCREEGTLVLRGMYVATDLRGTGVGTELLDRVSRAIGSSPCWCVPYDHLERFYGRIGFRVVDDDEAPAFLAARKSRYTEGGRAVTIMHRREGRAPESH